MLHLCTYGCLLRPLQVDRGHCKRRVRLRTATWVNFTATRYNTLVPALSEPKQRVGRRMPPEGGEKCLANVHYSITKLSGEPSGSLASCSERKGEGRHASMGHHRATLARAPLTAAFCLPEP